MLQQVPLAEAASGSVTAEGVQGVLDYIKALTAYSAKSDTEIIADPRPVYTSSPFLNQRPDGWHDVCVESAGLTPFVLTSISTVDFNFIEIEVCARESQNHSGKMLVIRHNGSDIVDADTYASETVFDLTTGGYSVHGFTVSLSFSGTGAARVIDVTCSSTADAEKWTARWRGVRS